MGLNRASTQRLHCGELCSRAIDETHPNRSDAEPMQRRIGAAALPLDACASIERARRGMRISPPGSFSSSKTTTRACEQSMRAYPNPDVCTCACRRSSPDYAQGDAMLHKSRREYAPDP